MQAAKSFFHTFLCRKTWGTGIAIFSMFFGAGNVIFPLLVGIRAGEHFFFGVLGLVLTAVGGPLLGLLSSTLFRGDVDHFFCRAGKIAGRVMIYAAIALLGPFAVLPRCIMVAYSAFGAVFPGIDLLIFSLIFCALALAACLWQSHTLSLLGYLLSPLLLICLGAIIVQALLSPGDVVISNLSIGSTLRIGLETGYDTLDLVAALFFGPSIWHLLKLQFQTSQHVDPPAHKLLHHATVAALIGGGCLGIVYLGLSFAANQHGVLLSNVPPVALMPTLAMSILGPVGGLLASLTTALACFTTVIGLSISLVQVIKEKAPSPKIKTNYLLVGILGLTAIFALLDFDALMHLIHAAVVLLYPAMIAITACNLAYKIWGWRLIKTPFYLTLGATVLSLLWH